MMSPMANETAASTEAKTSKPKHNINDKRKARTALRKAARKARTEKLNSDPEFRKAYFAARKTRANSRVAAFKKAKSGKK